MKNAQAKIDALLDALVEMLHDEIVAFAAPISAMTPEVFDGLIGRLRKLIELSNLNNVKQAKEGREPGPQSKVPEISNEQLMKELKETRKPSENFPRSGPRNGKRENVAPPEPIVTCAVHEGVICTPGAGGLAVCPDCAKAPEARPAEFVSLKALL